MRRLAIPIFHKGSHTFKADKVADKVERSFAGAYHFPAKVAFHIAACSLRTVMPLLNGIEAMRALRKGGGSDQTESRRHPCHPSVILCGSDRCYLRMGHSSRLLLID